LDASEARDKVRPMGLDEHILERPADEPGIALEAASDESR
jgi:hypothetical protein